MKRNILALATASAIALATLAPSVHAMENEYNMLTGALFNSLAARGLPTDKIADLTMSEVGAITGILQSDDVMGSNSQIKLILDKH